MSRVEIPLLRESAPFAARLIAAARQFDEPKYQFHRRVNWSHRYEESFYELEAECFRADPEAYLAGQARTPPRLADVFRQRLRGKQVLTVLAKVFAHWLFRWLGLFAERGIRAQHIATYRKGYVDDIELVFDPAEPGVLRAIYPFPINLRRQLRYLRALRQRGHRFKLAGHAYGLGDLIRFLGQRDVHSLMRLESRAQVRHAREVVALGVKAIQLSDEFDIGSLDFARTLARLAMRVVNSAHGVGKYFPVHAYQEFRVLTRRQAEYYHAVGRCAYPLRRLNDTAPSMPAHAQAHVHAHAPAPAQPGSERRVQLVLLSQAFVGVSEVIAANEARVVERLRAEFAAAPGVRLLYKPHPNNHRPAAPAGFERLSGLAEVNGQAGTVFVSFFSTCQIDPAFKGRKVLLRGELIHPEISFDDSETIVDIAGLVDLVRAQQTVRAAESLQ